MENLTSSDVNGVPSWKVTPSRSLKLPGGLVDRLPGHGEAGLELQRLVHVHERVEDVAQGLGLAAQRGPVRVDRVRTGAQGRSSGPRRPPPARREQGRRCHRRPHPQLRHDDLHAYQRLCHTTGEVRVVVNRLLSRHPIWTALDGPNRLRLRTSVTHGRYDDGRGADGSGGGPAGGRARRRVARCRSRCSCAGRWSTGSRWATGRRARACRRSGRWPGGWACRL